MDINALDQTDFQKTTQGSHTDSIHLYGAPCRWASGYYQDNGKLTKELKP